MVRVADVFAPSLPPAKQHPRLIDTDVQHFAAVRQALRRNVEDLTARLDVLRRTPAAAGQQAMERDLQTHRLVARLNAMQRLGLDLCLGRIVPDDGAAPIYVARCGLLDDSDAPLLVDWRSGAAEPFFAATLARPLGVASRRRYRWADGLITDYTDETFLPDEDHERLALDAQSAFLAGLGSARSSRMRDVLSTIQADQDAIIRAGSHGALVVEGGPGTGKTVVALHRAAYLLHADPRMRQGRGEVLVIGPHHSYLRYVADILPGLGEDGVAICTLADLVTRTPVGADDPSGDLTGTEPSAVTVEPDAEVARLKSTMALVAAIEPAVGLYEEPPTSTVEIDTDAGPVTLTPGVWAAAFGSVDPGTPHNEAPAQIWDSLLELLLDQLPTDEDPAQWPDEAADLADPARPDRDQLRAQIAADADLTTLLRGAWPILEPTELIADLWEVPAYLRRCVPSLNDDEVRRLERPPTAPWTDADLPLIDAARLRVGDPQHSRTQRRQAEALVRERSRMDLVVQDLLDADHDHDEMVQTLRQGLVRDALDDETALPGVDRDRLTGPFAHVIIDEAQELTDAQWQMVINRCPARSFTVVGDRAQARTEFAESWHTRLARVGIDRVTRMTLHVNYRTPQEVMRPAADLITATLPWAVVPTSVRTTGIPIQHRSRTELSAILNDWADQHAEGVGCVISTAPIDLADQHPRISVLTPADSKGLEFDLVVLLDEPDTHDPQDAPGQQPEQGRSRTPAVARTGQVTTAVDRYVAMTRTTGELIMMT